MALSSTMHVVALSLSDVDRATYGEFEVRLARHPSETPRFLACRLLAYALFYEEGIAFSKGGLSSAEEAPIAVRDATGTLKWWIDIGQPTAERLHKASKAAEHVAVVTTADPRWMEKEWTTRAIHRAEEIAVLRFDAPWVDALAGRLERRTEITFTRSDGVLYLKVGGTDLETTPERVVIPSPP